MGSSKQEYWSGVPLPSPPLYFKKTLLHKSSEWSRLVSGPGLNSSLPEAKNPGIFLQFSNNLSLCSVFLLWDWHWLSDWPALSLPASRWSHGLSPDSSVSVNVATKPAGGGTAPRPGLLTNPSLSLGFHAWKLGFPHSSVSKESACNAADPALIPVLGRSPGEGNGNPLPYSCLESPMDRGD